MSKRNIAAVGRVKQLATNQLCCNKWCLFFFVAYPGGGQGGRQKSEPSNLGDWICCDTCWQCFDHLWPPDHGIVIRYFSTKWSLGKPFGSMRWIANLNAKNFDRWPSQVFVKFWPIPNWRSIQGQCGMGTSGNSDNHMSILWLAGEFLSNATAQIGGEVVYKDGPLQKEP